MPSTGAVFGGSVGAVGVDGAVGAAVGAGVGLSVVPAPGVAGVAGVAGVVAVGAGDFGLSPPQPANRPPTRSISAAHSRIRMEPAKHVL